MNSFTGNSGGFPRKVALVRQTEMTECGLACLAMVANYHGFDIDLGSLRREFKASQRGVTIKSLIDIADRLGFLARAVKISLQEIAHLECPAILHWDLNHYVVLEKVVGDEAVIHNPEGRSEKVRIQDLSDHFTGIALELRPGEDFEPVAYRERVKLSQLWRSLTGMKRALLQVVILSAIMQIFVLASPYYMQLAIDSVLPAMDENLLVVLAIGFLLFTFINAMATLMRSFVLLTAGSAFAFGISGNVARRLFRLPISWFESRHVGDVLSRFQSVTPIRQFMTEGAVAAVLDGMMTVFALAIMLYYSLELAALAIVAFILYLGVRLTTFALQKRAQEESIVMLGKEQSTLIETIRGIVTLRLFNRESQRHAYWQGRLTESINANVRLGRIFAWQQAANALIFGVETVLAIWLAISLVLNGGFSVGMLFAYLAYKTQFLQRGGTLIDQLIAFRMLGLHLERISDIALSDQDISFKSVSMEARECTGDIELEKVSFQYSPQDRAILEDIDLKISAGEHVAITGPSGGGKSTLVKILLGLVEPTRGTVLVDGIPLREFGHKNLHEQVGAVLQEDSLFAGSLGSNVALFDETPDQDRIEDCCRLASIHDDIMAMPMAYDTLVGDMGSTLSGGQKQRLLLARALYRKPRILVLDESTSALDPAREYRINAEIEKMGITRIVIAHRVETILKAERIMGLKNGRLSDITQEFRNSL